MAQGGVSKALVIIARAKGWDPTRIFDPRTGYGESIANFDKAPELFVNQAGTGKIPADVTDQNEIKFSTAPPWQHTSGPGVDGGSSLDRGRTKP